MADFKYVGFELELFAAAVNWKHYWAEQIRRFIHGDVLEVGAGIGANTAFLSKHAQGRWVCLEPDPSLVKQLGKTVGQLNGTHGYETICGTVASLDPQELFDTILYIDVLEHIEDDRAEMNCAASHLRGGGYLVVLAPAHQWLFTPFDASIGHFRRYNRPTLRNLRPLELSLEKLIYLDSVGMLASSANRLFLRQAMPTKAQLQLWDKWVVPTSRVIDRLLGHSVGKSIVSVWRKRGSTDRN